MAPLTVAALALLAVTSASAGDLAGGNAPAGVRVDALGESAVGLRYEAVTGADGGISALTAQARLHLGELWLLADLPFTTYRTPLGHDTNLGHVSLGAFMPLPNVASADSTHVIGLRANFAVGEHAWTWLNRPDQVWPGAGIDVLYRLSTGLGQGTLIVQGSLGAQTSPGVRPFPERWLRLGASAVYDRDLSARFGLTGEASIQYWDTTPFELSALGRADLVEGLRLRAGLLLPVATWAGWTPSGRPSGVREVTLLAELTLTR